MSVTSSFDAEVESRSRFEFGKNWRAFLRVLTPERITVAETSLRDMLGVTTLRGRSFLDVGSGSGLSSLAARNLGATVTSFDFDPASTICTNMLRDRYHPADPGWRVFKGSVLDRPFLESLGQHDVVYSWGVLHHTGKLWEALDNVVMLVKPGGTLFVAIYNDQGRASKLWRAVKKLYCSGVFGRAAVCGIFIPYFFAVAVASSLLNLENVFATYYRNRGMSVMRDWIDWLGGYPFEVARADQIFTFYQQRGFTLKTMRTTSGLGNNQFVFEKTER